MDFKSIEELKAGFYDVDINEALYYSVKFHYYDGINIALKNGGDIHYEQDIIFYARLVVDDYDMCKYLISIGVDIHVNNDEYLSQALFEGDYKKCIKLIELGANINKVTVDKKKFLTYLRNLKLNKIL